MTTEKQALMGKELIDYCAGQLVARKVEGLTLMQLNNLSDVCDAYLVGTCKSEAQMRAVLSGLNRSLRKTTGQRPISTDFRNGALWGVMDMGDLMVHLFETNYRETISLEKLWADATQIELNPDDYKSVDVDGDEGEDHGLL